MNIIIVMYYSHLLKVYSIPVYRAKYFTKIRSIPTVSLWRRAYFPNVQVGNLELTKLITWCLSTNVNLNSYQFNGNIRVLISTFLFCDIVMPFTYENTSTFLPLTRWVQLPGFVFTWALGSLASSFTVRLWGVPSSSYLCDRPSLSF